MKALKKLENRINREIIRRFGKPRPGERNKYLFRGENCDYNQKSGEPGMPEKPRKAVASGLYRHYCLRDRTLEKDYLILAKEVIEKARRHFPPNTSNIEILTELQHFGGKTALIDFTYNLHIAIFFAGYGEPKKPGYLYIYSKDAFSEAEDIKYAKNTQSILQEKNVLIEPIGKGPRPIAQHSVFVHAREGYLSVSEDQCLTIKISSDEKKELLRDLEQYYNIKGDTVYNDIHGMIREQDSYPPDETVNLVKAMAHFEKGEYEAAAGYFKKVIELNPYHNRARDYLGATWAKIDYEAAGSNKTNKTES